MIAAKVNDLVRQVARMTRAHVELATRVVLILQVPDDRPIERQPVPPAVHLEDLRKLLEGWVFRENLVRDAPQERFVGE